MKIMLESDLVKVEIEYPDCKESIPEIIDNLFIPALQGLGFAGVEEFFDEEDPPVIKMPPENLGEYMARGGATKRFIAEGEKEARSLKEEKCTTCNGEGWVRVGIPNQLPYHKHCPDCCTRWVCNHDFGIDGKGITQCALCGKIGEQQ